MKEYKLTAKRLKALEYARRNSPEYFNKFGKPAKTKTVKTLMPEKTADAAIARLDFTGLFSFKFNVTIKKN